jgi:hypothetical protein
MAMGHMCACHFHRSLVPIEIHHVWPLGEGGPNVASNKVTVCANGHSSIHDLLAKLVKGQGKVPWSVRIHYGWRTRRIAARGYAAIQAMPPKQSST